MCRCHEDGAGGSPAATVASHAASAAAKAPPEATATKEEEEEDAGGVSVRASCTDSEHWACPASWKHCAAPYGDCRASLCCASQWRWDPRLQKDRSFEFACYRRPNAYWAMCR